MFYIALPEPFLYVVYECDDTGNITSLVFSDVPRGEKCKDVALGKEICAYVQGEKTDFTRSYTLSKDLTPFTLSVFKVVAMIPYGKVLTYKEIAEKIGKPKASRAVGGACSKNSLAILIPCHRVVRTKGEDFLYVWGKERKEALLSLEKSLHLLS